MVDFTLPHDKFKVQVRESLRMQLPGWRTARIAKHDPIYTSGERDAMVYFIESGLVKLVLPSYEGRECLLSIRTAGDIFGELCLSGQPTRLETAVAMNDSVLKQITSRDFLANMKASSLLEGLVQYLAVRVSEQQEVIAAMATVNSEKRLARTLLHLGRVIGKNDSRSMRINQRISHEELSAMVGTTRPRVGILLKKFRQLGLIGVTPERGFVIEEKKIREYLSRDCFVQKENSGREQEPISQPDSPTPIDDDEEEKALAISSS